MLYLKWSKNWLQPAFFHGPRLTIFGGKEKKFFPGFETITSLEL